MSEKINEEMLRTLKEMLKWIKFTGVKEVRAVLSNTLETDQKRLIFHLSDGNRGIIEIGKLANVGSSTVARYWEAWYRLGLMEPINVQRGIRYKKAFELEDFGLSIPQTRIATSEFKESIQTLPTKEIGETE
jgi:hypothetical protein